jgi:uncharacterized membrane protein
MNPDNILLLFLLSVLLCFTVVSLRIITDKNPKTISVYVQLILCFTIIFSCTIIVGREILSKEGKKAIYKELNPYGFQE